MLAAACLHQCRDLDASWRPPCVFTSSITIFKKKKKKVERRKNPPSEAAGPTAERRAQHGSQLAFTLTVFSRWIFPSGWEWRMRLKLHFFLPLCPSLQAWVSEGVKRFCNAQAGVPARVRIVKGIRLEEDLFKCSLLDNRVHLLLCASRLVCLRLSILLFGRYITLDGNTTVTSPRLHHKHNVTSPACLLVRALSTRRRWMDRNRSRSCVIGVHSSLKLLDCSPFFLQKSTLT